MTLDEAIDKAERLIRGTIADSRRRLETDLVASDTDPDDIDDTLAFTDEHNETVIAAMREQVRALLRREFPGCDPK